MRIPSPPSSSLPSASKPVVARKATLMPAAPARPHPGGGNAPVEIAYAAPPGTVTRPRTEYVAVHLATPDGGAGVFLGSTPIRIVPGGG